MKYMFLFIITVFASTETPTPPKAPVLTNVGVGESGFPPLMLPSANNDYDDRN